MPRPKVTVSTIACLSIAMSSAWRTSFFASAPCSWLISRWSSRVEGSRWTVRFGSFCSSATRENGTKIAASSSPACTFSMRVLSSGTEIHSTPSRLTRSASQKFGFFSRITRSPRRHSLTVKAPEATGFSA